MFELTTIHKATFQYWWIDEAIHTSAVYDVRDEIESYLSSVLKQYNDVWENTQFCCQFEGFEIESDNIEHLKSVALDLEVFIRRFNIIKPLM